MSDTKQVPSAPVATIDNKTSRPHGKEVVDPYHWLRDDSRSDEAVLGYLREENAYTEAVMEPTRDLQQALYDEMLSRIKQTDVSVPEPFGPFEYYWKTVEGKEYGYHYRRPRGRQDQEGLLIDENQLAEGHDYFRLGAFSVSPDHKLLAYSTDTDGSERYTIRVKNLETGELLADEIPGCSTGVEWSADGTTLFYVILDRAHRPHRLMRHRLGSEAAQDPVLHEENDEAFFVSLYKTKNQRFLVLSMDSNTTSESRILAADDPEGEWRTVVPRRHKVEYSVEQYDDRLLMLTNDGAINFKLLEAPLDDLDRWAERIGHREEVKLESLDVFRGHVVVGERRDGNRGLRIYRLPDWSDHAVEFPEPAHMAYSAANPEFETKTLRFVYSSMITPRSVFDYDMDSTRRELRKEQEVLGGYDREQYVTERIHATAPDGTAVPISLVYRKDGAGRRPAPTILYGYGSYGISVDPVFDSNRLSLLDRGFVYAIGHVRGGGDLGRPWYEAGKLGRKRNTFDDFIACAERLIDGGYTAADRLTIRGGSAGGLLVGAVTNMRPELFRCVVAKVPFVDVMNTMMDATIPLTVIEYEEWGNPNEPAVYDYMAGYSPYDNVTAQTYPNMLITGGLNDPRVQYWEPAKWAARLRALRTDSNLLLLRTEMGAGHAGPSGRYEYLRELAFEMAFTLRVMPEGAVSVPGR